MFLVRTMESLFRYASVLIIILTLISYNPVLTERIDQLNSDNNSHQRANSVFVTSSDASSFIQLENLIGSIHQHAPMHHILVYDLGLTSIQRTILTNYFHVHIQAFPWNHSTHSRHEDLLHVTIELIQHALTLCDRIIYLDRTVELVDYPWTIERLLNEQGYVYIAQEDLTIPSECCRIIGQIDRHSKLLHSLHINNADRYENKILSSTDIQAYDLNADRRYNAVELVLKPFASSLININSSPWESEQIFSIVIHSVNLSIHTDLRLSAITNSVHYLHFKREIIRRNRDPFHSPYIDLIKKRYKLAIVIPFISRQLNDLFRQLRISNIYQPCRENTSRSVDFLLYYNKIYTHALESKIRHYIRHLKNISKCFNRIELIYADLNATEDVYPNGINLMWQRLFFETSMKHLNLSLRTRGYTHFFWMEPDTRPIRHYWLNALIDEITGGSSKPEIISNWWIRGSIYRGTLDIEDYLIHINGNALYHLSSLYLFYLTLVSEFYPFKKEMNAAFDTDQFFYMLGTCEDILWNGSKSYRQGLAKRFWHKFVFSEFIQNCAYTGCPDHPIFDAPLTYFIHGNAKNISTNKPISPSETNSTFPMEILFLLIICVFFTLLFSGRFRKFFKKVYPQCRSFIQWIKRRRYPH